MQKNEGAADRACDLYRESEYEVKVSKFLTPQEQIIVWDTLSAAVGKGTERCFFWGGCRGTERCAAVFLPEWYVPDSNGASVLGRAERELAFAEFLSETDGAGAEVKSEIPICAVRISGSGFKKLAHKDFMGSVLSLGIERNMIGDIVVVSESEAVIFAMKNIAEFIVSELKKIGRDGVKCRIDNLSPMHEIERVFESIVISVSSMRLDGIVNQLTGEGRASSAELIINGLVEHNYFTASNVSADVKPGDIVSVRGYGKFVIGETSGNTKSGRIRLHCKKYM